MTTFEFKQLCEAKGAVVVRICKAYRKTHYRAYLAAPFGPGEATCLECPIDGKTVTPIRFTDSGQREVRAGAFHV